MAVSDKLNQPNSNYLLKKYQFAGEIGTTRYVVNLANLCLALQFFLVQCQKIIGYCWHALPYQTSLLFCVRVLVGVVTSASGVV